MNGKMSCLSFTILVFHVRSSEFHFVLYCCSLFVLDMLNQKLQSRAWSCSELVAGATSVLAMAAAKEAPGAAMLEAFLQEDLTKFSEEELAALLKDYRA